MADSKKAITKLAILLLDNNNEKQLSDLYDIGAKAENIIVTLEDSSSNLQKMIDDGTISGTIEWTDMLE